MRLKTQERLLSTCRISDVNAPYSTYTVPLNPFKSVYCVSNKKGDKSLVLWSPPTNCSCYPKASRDLNLSEPPLHKVLAAIMQWLASFSRLCHTTFQATMTAKKYSQVSSTFGLNGIFSRLSEKLHFYTHDMLIGCDTIPQRKMARYEINCALDILQSLVVTWGKAVLVLQLFSYNRDENEHTSWVTNNLGLTQ